MAGRFFATEPPGKLKYPLDVHKQFLGGEMVKNPPANAGDALREGNDNTLQYSCLENSMDGGAWCAIVCGVSKSQTRLSTHTKF